MEHLHHLPHIQVLFLQRCQKVSISGKGCRLNSQDLLLCASVLSRHGIDTHAIILASITPLLPLWVGLAVVDTDRSWRLEGGHSRHGGRRYSWNNNDGMSSTFPHRHNTEQGRWRKHASKCVLLWLFPSQKWNFILLWRFPTNSRVYTRRKTIQC